MTVFPAIMVSTRRTGIPMRTLCMLRAPCSPCDSQITIVGRILDVSETATKVAYTVHDGSGALELQMHAQEDDEVVCVFPWPSACIRTLACSPPT